MSIVDKTRENGPRWFEHVNFFWAHWERKYEEEKTKKKGGRIVDTIESDNVRAVCARLGRVKYQDKYLKV